MSYVVPITRREAALRQLREEIVTGRLKPGTVIKDAEVAARLGVSITPVREAIAQLAAEGLIDIAPNRARHVTHVTQKSTLELIDVMQVLACAGVEWGIDNLTDSHLQALRSRFDDFKRLLREGNVAAASPIGADFSSILISASGNRELQTHVDLVVARTVRALALGQSMELWEPWINGYQEVLESLERGDRQGAVDRYRRIYSDYRAAVQQEMFESEGGPDDGTDDAVASGDVGGGANGSAHGRTGTTD